MALKVKCKCGKIYEIKPEWLGKKLRCKKCDHVIVLPKTVPKKKIPQSAAAGKSSAASAGPAKQSAHPAKKKSAVASGGLDDLLGGDLAALEQSAATVETTRKPPPKKAVSTAYTPGGGGHTSMDRKSAERAASLTGIRPPASTNFLLAIIAGVVAGACGAGVWAAIAYYADMQIGLIAWGVGALVGLAMIAVGREGSFLLGVCSVVIVFCSIIAGKAMVINMLLSDYMNEEGMAGIVEFSEEDYIGLLVDDIAVEREAAGKPVDWPEVDYSKDHSVEDEYPADIWREATAEWNDMGADGQAAYQQQMEAEVGELGGAVRGAAVGLGVVFSFGLFDIVFFGLAMVTSFKVTMGGLGD